MRLAWRLNVPQVIAGPRFSRLVSGFGVKS
jgi:hypothetical protein